jgi:hypothetical protein
MTQTKEPNDKRLRETIALIKKIADSREDLREGRWLTQEEMEDVLEKMWREL